MVLVLLLTGCYDVDLLSIELKEDLSSGVTFVISPFATEEIRTKQDWSQSNSDSFFETIKQEFGKCGFAIQRNYRYDADGVSGSRNFSSLAELEQAVNCLSVTGSQSSPIQIKSPSKSEELLQNSYKLQVDLRSPHLLADSFLKNALQPLKELKILMPGKIDSISIENPSPTLSVKKSNTSPQTASFKVEQINLRGEALTNYFKRLKFDSSGVNLNSIEELKKAFQEQTAVNPNNFNEMQKYVDSKIPPFTSITLISSKPKVDIGIIVAIVIGLLTVIATVLPSFINKK